MKRIILLVITVFTLVTSYSQTCYTYGVKELGLLVYDGKDYGYFIKDPRISSYDWSSNIYKYDMNIFLEEAENICKKLIEIDNQLSHEFAFEKLIKSIKLKDGKRISYYYINHVLQIRYEGLEHNNWKTKFVVINLEITKSIEELNKFRTLLYEAENRYIEAQKEKEEINQYNKQIDELLQKQNW